MTDSPRAVLSPVDGAYVPIEAVADPAFAQKMMGDGFAVAPASDIVVAPVTGEVTAKYPTGHAFGLRADNGLELIVHVGIDTVGEGGASFSSRIEKGQRVAAGDMLVRFDRAALAEKGYDTTVIVVLLAVPGGSAAQKPLVAGKAMEAGKTVAVTF